jgi:hypothetical protein
MKFFKILLRVLLGFISLQVWASNGNNHFSTKPFTLLDEKKHEATVEQANEDITAILLKLNELRKTTAKGDAEKEQELLLILQPFLSRPYLALGAQGESNWPVRTKDGSIEREHIQQDPVYRTDAFNCATLVETGLALMNSSSLSEFKKSIVNVEYGAAQLPESEALRYCNRNNFTSKDLNPVNQQHHYIQDITTQMPFPITTQTVSAWIDPEKWFLHLGKDLRSLQKNVRVFSDETGTDMVRRLREQYIQTYCPALKAKNVTMSYIPKQAFVLKEGNQYIPNQALLQKIPTPAIAEIVRDDDYWYSEGQLIQQKIGTGIIVSHLGFLYQAHFKQGEEIYQKITCEKNRRQRICNVQPVVCETASCDRLMFSHATDAYPNQFLYYKTTKGWVCRPEKPAQATTPYTFCNRVVAVPLGEYVTQQQNKQYSFMDNPSILGINVQKIITP